MGQKEAFWRSFLRALVDRERAALYALNAVTRYGDDAVRGR
jgi:hypothetical protein